jgi:DNA-binding transcriptional LysR family regulator
MQLHHARYALALCEERSFSRAAKRCGVAQPSITVAIKRLEAEIGATLFLRSTGKQRETLPTAVMLTIKPHLTQALLAIERAKQAAIEFQHPKVDKHKRARPVDDQISKYG